jgi:hypothetical protein
MFTTYFLTSGMNQDVQSSGSAPTSWKEEPTNLSWLVELSNEDIPGIGHNYTAWHGPEGPPRRLG